MHLLIVVTRGRWPVRRVEASLKAGNGLWLGGRLRTSNGGKRKMDGGAAAGSGADSFEEWIGSMAKAEASLNASSGECSIRAARGTARAAARVGPAATRLAAMERGNRARSARAGGAHKPSYVHNMVHNSMIVSETPPDQLPPMASQQKQDHGGVLAWAVALKRHFFSSTS